MFIRNKSKLYLAIAYTGKNWFRGHKRILDTGKQSEEKRKDQPEGKKMELHSMLVSINLGGEKDHTESQLM